MTHRPAGQARPLVGRGMRGDCDYRPEWRILRLMRSIVVINQKGGVGKTTTAVNVAAGLARIGRRVLLVDLDAQAHATQSVGIDSSDAITIYDVLLRGAPLLDAMRIVGENLTLVPSHIDLVAGDVELRDHEDRESVLLSAFEAVHDDFDVCVMDCAPSLGLVTINALAAGDEVIIPLQPHFLALQGLGKLLETVSLVRGVLRPELRVSGIVLCMYESATRLAREVRDDVSQFIRDAEFQDAWYGARVFETAIRKDIKLAEAPSFGKTIFEYAPKSRAAADYEALAVEIGTMTNAALATEPPVSIPISELGPAAPPAISGEHADASTANRARDVAAS